jgi:hypothetical protein
MNFAYSLISFVLLRKKKIIKKRFSEQKYTGTNIYSTYDLNSTVNFYHENSTGTVINNK